MRLRRRQRRPGGSGKKLASGVRVARANPRIAERDCNHCQEFQYDEDSGLVQLLADGSPVKRMAFNKPPCRTRGCYCDKGTPEYNLNHTPQNREAYEHYKQCRATGDWPRSEDGQVDPIVKQNAAIIQEAEEAWQREEWTKFRVSMLEIASVMRSV